MSGWSKDHFRAAIRVLHYLEQTKRLGLVYPKGCDLTLSAWSDAEFASQFPDCKSVSGFSVFMGPCLVSSSAKKQTVVALSTAAAEYYALSSAAIEVLLLRSIMGFLGENTNESPTTIYVDSISAKAIAERLSDTKRTKTIGVRYNYVHHYIEEGFLELAYIESKEMVSDIFTKPLSRDLFTKHRLSLLGQLANTACCVYLWVQS
jgi:hypothetical protein